MKGMTELKIRADAATSGRATSLFTLASVAASILGFYGQGVLHANPRHGPPEVAPTLKGLLLVETRSYTGNPFVVRSP
jgi:hypothetical protein